MKPIPESFFKKDTIKISKDLLGKYIIHKNLIGKIVETEAYLKDDPASHSFKGLTKRNSAMFGPPGYSYIYFTYGMYHCLNITTNKEGIGEAVLIRSIEPVKGINQMKKNRKLNSIKNLTNGPAKLTIALNLNINHNNINFLNPNSPIKIMQPNKKEKFEIIETERIGISKGRELPHRFYIKDNLFVSKK